MSTNHPTPLITVVMPVYNRPELVVRALDSIKAQDYRPFNLIVVDNNSTDNTLEEIHDWAKNLGDNTLSVKILSASERGAAKARQRGVDEVNTPWVLHFDSDDSMRPGHLSRIAKGIADNPKADILGWDVLTHKSDNSTKTDRFYAHNALINHIFHSSLASLRYAVRTDLLRRVGGWETDIAGWDDYVLGVKLLLSNPLTVKLGNEITVDVYTQAESVTGISFSSKQGEWERALDRCQLLIDKAGRSELTKWIEARRAIVAGHYTSEGNSQGLKSLQSVCTGKTRYMRWALTRIHNHVARRRRGTAWLCRILLANTK